MRRLTRHEPARNLIHVMLFCQHLLLCSALLHPPLRTLTPARGNCKNALSMQVKLVAQSGQHNMCKKSGTGMWQTATPATRVLLLAITYAVLGALLSLVNFTGTTQPTTKIRHFLVPRQLKQQLDSGETGQQQQLLQAGTSYLQQQQQRQPHMCNALAQAPLQKFPLRPKLMIIVAETSDRHGRAESAYVIDNFRQYCQLHGYLFQYHSYQPRPRLGVFMTKWAELLQYWHMADWLLLVDSDTIVANLSKSFDAVLDRPEHVVMQLRPRSREVDAAAVALRTSEFSKCFIQRWLDIFEQTVDQNISMNNDNGPLLATVLEFLDPVLATKCFSNYSTYDNYRICFEDVFPLLPHAFKLAPIKVFMPLTGFLREHIGGSADVSPPISAACTQQGVERVLMERCWSNDLLISGWKQIGTQMWAAAQDTTDQTLSLNGTRPLCHWNTLGEELFVAQNMCFVNYPGCYDARGVNICKLSPLCSNLVGSQRMQVRAEIGFGINRLDVSDPVWEPVWSGEARCSWGKSEAGDHDDSNVLQPLDWQSSYLREQQAGQCCQNSVVHI